jgi:predicted  nucleic acid-binding Zn ribbon protein
MVKFIRKEIYYYRIRVGENEKKGGKNISCPAPSRKWE